MSLSLLAERVTSAFPLSIGTSLAFESLSDTGGTPYDPAREIPQKVDLNQYQQFWINLSTLFRNLHGAVPSSETSSLVAEDCAQVLLQEIDVINNVLREETHLRCQPVYYISNYKSLKSLSSTATIRIPNTPKQIAYYKLHDRALQEVINILNTRQEPVKVFNNQIIPETRNTSLIMTHVPYDLLCYSKFNQLELIESHTGILKKRNLWYTKFYQSEELIMIPFIEIMLKFFGDNHTFRPFPMKARKTIVDLAVDKRWTWATTDAKVRQDLGMMKDRLLGDVIKIL